MLNDVAERIVSFWKALLAENSQTPSVNRSAYQRAYFLTASDRYSDPDNLRRKLLRAYRGKTLDDVLEGEEIETSRGKCYALGNECDLINSERRSAAAAKEIISADLQLVMGIGPITAQRLKDEGYRDLSDLASHPRFRGQATELLNILEEADGEEIHDRICERYVRSHPLAFLTSSFHNIEDFLFLDIETMGLFNVPLFLIGLSFIRSGKIITRQYLARDVSEEAAVISNLQGHLQPATVLVTYNGRAFDVPYIESRASFYRMDTDIYRLNYDMLFFSRRAWRGQLPDCRLSTVERHFLGVKRIDDVSGESVPMFYDSFRRNGNPGPLVPIIQHNRQDMISLVHIFLKMSEGQQL
jgi:hypothetical protein